MNATSIEQQASFEIHLIVKSVIAHISYLAISSAKMKHDYTKCLRY